MVSRTAEMRHDWLIWARSCKAAERKLPRNFKLTANSRVFLVAIRPPAPRPISNTVTSTPASVSFFASVQPEIPAPTTPTRMGCDDREDIQAVDALAAAVLVALSKTPALMTRRNGSINDCEQTTLARRSATRASQPLTMPWPQFLYAESDEKVCGLSLTHLRHKLSRSHELRKYRYGVCQTASEMIVDREDVGE